MEPSSLDQLIALLCERCMCVRERDQASAAPVLLGLGLFFFCSLLYMFTLVMCCERRQRRQLAFSFERVHCRRLYVSSCEDSTGQ